MLSQLFEILPKATNMITLGIYLCGREEEWICTATKYTNTFSRDESEYLARRKAVHKFCIPPNLQYVTLKGMPAKIILGQIPQISNLQQISYKSDRNYELYKPFLEKLPAEME